MDFIVKTTSAGMANTLSNIIIEKDDIVGSSMPLVITIPSEIKGFKIHNIGNTGKESSISSIFFDKDIPESMLKGLAISLVISEGIEVINELAFAGDKHLQSVTLPSSVIAIMEKSFMECQALRKITVPKDSKLDYIGNRAFFESTLKEFDFPASIKYIGNKAFANSFLQVADFTDEVEGLIILTEAFSHSKLKSVKFPKKIKKINNSAFMCITPLETVVFPADCSLTALPKLCFDFCSNLKSVTLGHKLKTLKEKAFSFCVALNEINLEDTSVTELGPSCFLGCGKLTQLTFPETLTSLGDNCFSKSGIKKFDLSNIQSIGAACFSNSCIQEVTLPAYETYEIRLFSECPQLRSVKFTGVEKVSKMTFSDYMFSSTYSLKKFVFPEKLVEIGKNAFFYSGIGDLDLSRTKISSIHDLAFAHTNIDSLSLPPYIGYISQNAFAASEYPENVVASSAVFIT